MRVDEIDNIGFPVTPCFYFVCKIRENCFNFVPDIRHAKQVQDGRYTGANNTEKSDSEVEGDDVDEVH